MALFEALVEFDQVACLISNTLGNYTNLNWVGDLICDDNLNIEACNYDGGDCCKNLSDLQPYGLCSVCKCHLDVATNSTTMESFVNDKSVTASTLDASLTSMVWQNDFELNNLKQDTIKKNDACVQHSIFCIYIYAVILSFHRLLK